jgi:hypothetical protein
MTDTRRQIIDVIEDVDATDELPRRRLFGGYFGETRPSPEAIHAENQATVNENLGSELRDANEKISSLSSELESRSEAMLSMQRKLEELQNFANFLENEVASGKDVISHVTDELISVRSQQNDVEEQLRRREQQIAALRNKAEKKIISSEQQRRQEQQTAVPRNKTEKKSTFSEQFARQVSSAGPADAQEQVSAQRTNGSGQPTTDRSPTLVARHGNAATRYSIQPGGMSLGTGGENDIQLHDALVSQRHAKITNTPSGCVLKDLGSANGTWINQRRVKMQVLHDGDVIVIGSLRFDYFEQGDR